MTTHDAQGRHDAGSPTAPVPWAPDDWSRALAPTRRKRSRVKVGAVLAILGVLAILAALIWRAPLQNLLTANAAPGLDPDASAPPVPHQHPVAAPAAPAPPVVPGPDPVLTTSVAVPAIAAVIPTLDTPGYVEITPDGRQAWIAHRDTRNDRGQYVISVLDLQLGAIVATVASPAGPPRFIAFCPTGTPGAGRAYVSVYSTRADGQAEGAAPHLVSIIDLVTMVEIGQIPVGRGPVASSCSPDGSTLVVPSHDDGRLDIVDTATATLRTSVPVLPDPHWAAHDNGGRIWTANHDSNAVTRVDAASLTVQDVQENIGISPHAVAVNPDSTRVAVVTFDSDELYLFDTATAAVVRIVALGRGPQDVAWTADGARVLTTDVDDDRVTVVDAATGTITAALQPPVSQPGTWDGPTSIAVTPDGATAVVTLLNTGAVALLNLTAS